MVQHKKFRKIVCFFLAVLMIIGLLEMIPFVTAQAATDTVAPQIEIFLLRQDPVSKKISTYIWAKDNETAASGLRYTTRFDVERQRPSDNQWYTGSVFELQPGVYTFAVSDNTSSPNSGNIAYLEYEVKWSDDFEGPAQKQDSILDGTVVNDVTGYVLGRTKYKKKLGDASVYEYPVAPNAASENERGLTLTFKVTPKATPVYIQGYLTLNNKNFNVDWYQDSTFTTPIEKTNNVSLAVTTAWGRVTIDPSKFDYSAKQTAAELYIKRYADSTLKNKIGEERYSMPCSVDVTAPSITVTYDSYSKQLNVSARDNIVGMTGHNNLKYKYDDKPDFIATENPYSTIYPTINTKDKFTIQVKAMDDLGNETTVTKNFSVSKIAQDSPPGAVGGSALNNSLNLNIAAKKTRLFKYYIVNGLINDVDVKVQYS